MPAKAWISLCLLFTAAWTNVCAQENHLRPGERPPGEHENLVQILRTTNKAQINKYVSETIEFKNVNPFNVINFLWAPLSREEGGIYSFINPDGQSGYVTVICPEYQLETLRNIARELDRPNLTSAPGSKYIYYRLRHRNAIDPGFLTVADYYLGDSGVLLPDVETNSILIFDAPEGSTQMEQAFIEKLDIPLDQVEVGVRIYEIDVNSDGTLGLDFQAWKNGPGRLLGDFQALGEVINLAGAARSSFNERGSGLYLDYPSAFFDFLVEKGKAKILTETRLTAVNRVPSVFTSGEEILFYETIDPFSEQTRQVVGNVAPAGVDPFAFPTNGQVFAGGNTRDPYRNPAIDGSFPVGQFAQDGRPIDSFIDGAHTGVTLSMVPTIGEQTINIDLLLEVINLNGFDGRGRPVTNSRSMSDSIAVSNGETVIFGGLTRERKVQMTRKIPLLGSLPVLGYLFGGEITTTQRSIVAASITPTLVLDSLNITQADRDLARQAREEEVVVMPRMEYCFEQLNRRYIY